MYYSPDPKKKSAGWVLGGCSLQETGGTLLHSRHGLHTLWYKHLHKCDDNSSSGELTLDFSASDKILLAVVSMLVSPFDIYSDKIHKGIYKMDIVLRTPCWAWFALDHNFHST